MYIDPFVPQLLALERMKDAMRRNEHNRLIRVATGSGKSRQWRFSMILALKNSLALFNRSPHKRLSAHTPNL